MSTLADTQRDFQRHVMHGDAKIVSAVNETANVPVATRLGIYSEAYRLRLRDALANNVPQLRELIGDDPFFAVAMQYLDEHPSQFRSVRWFGDRLAESLDRDYPSQPWLSELARWEWAIAAAFDSPDVSPLSLDALAAVAPTDWPELRFGFHPSLQQLEMKTNAPALFKALAAEQSAPEPALLERAQPWLIWRQELTTQYRSLGTDEAAALDRMREGGTFEQMCDVLCAWHAEDAVPLQAAGLLKQWMQDGCVIRFFAC